MTRRELAIGLGWGLVVLIVGLSLAPLPDSGPDVPYRDKWGHLLAYGVLMAWFARLYPRRATAWRFFIGFAALGTALELAQVALPYRQGDPIDGWANLIGLLLGMALAWAVKKMRSGNDPGSLLR